MHIHPQSRREPAVPPQSDSPVDVWAEGAACGTPSRPLGRACGIMLQCSDEGKAANGMKACAWRMKFNETSQSMPFPEKSIALNNL